mmetsp:Transcript_58718/g.135392  ORF Transcript_58718/g.135392 Transcript_58718/m.135392 type:complete len:257 (+) Transcript_58718:626-1396(+)
MLQCGGGGLHRVARWGRDAHSRQHQAQTLRGRAIHPQPLLPAELLGHGHLADQLQPLHQHVLVLLLCIPLRAVYHGCTDSGANATGCHYDHIDKVGLLQEGIVLIRSAPEHQHSSAEEHVGLVGVHGRPPRLPALRAQPGLRFLDMGQYICTNKKPLLGDVSAQRGQSAVLPKLTALQHNHSPGRRVRFAVKLGRHVQGVVHHCQKLRGAPTAVLCWLGHVRLAVPLELVPDQVLTVVIQVHRHPAPIGLLEGVLT